MKKNNMKYPDAKLHQTISFIKSGIRILGYIFLLINLPAAVCLLILSEAVGIAEELV
jgi:hypothetical protein